MSGPPVSRGAAYQWTRDAEATCATCGAAGPLAENAVYLRGPGTVVRCRRCSGMLMVISQIRGVSCVDLTGLTTLG